jgi:hypothetical protein
MKQEMKLAEERIFEDYKIWFKFLKKFLRFIRFWHLNLWSSFRFKSERGDGGQEIGNENFDSEEWEVNIEYWQLTINN